MTPKFPKIPGFLTRFQPVQGQGGANAAHELGEVGEELGREFWVKFRRFWEIRDFGDFWVSPAQAPPPAGTEAPEAPPRNPP